MLLFLKVMAGESAGHVFCIYNHASFFFFFSFFFLSQ